MSQFSQKAHNPDIVLGHPEIVVCLRLIITVQNHTVFEISQNDQYAILGW